MQTRYKIKTTVVRIEEHKRLARTIRTGKTLSDGRPEFQSEYESLGWFVLFDGSWEGIYIGTDKPEIQVGQEAWITIEF